MQQVDDFCNIRTLQMHCQSRPGPNQQSPIHSTKCQGLLTTYNGLNILQTKDYINVSCERYNVRISCSHIEQGWMKNNLIPDHPTPLPTTLQFLKDIQTTEGDPNPTTQKTLKKKMGFKYCSGIGQLVYPMVCCQPDLSFATVKLSQYNSCPAKIHFDGVQHALKYLYQTQHEGLYYSCTNSRPKLDIKLPAAILSTEHNLLKGKQQCQDPLTAIGMSNAEWASCTRT
jgi:hypothetical protein